MVNHWIQLFQGISLTSPTVQAISPTRAGILCVQVRAAYLQPGHALDAAGGRERYHLGRDEIGRAHV